MDNKFKIEIYNNNQNIDNLNCRNTEVSSIIKNQIQNADKDTILNLNQTEPNLQLNTMYYNYNFKNPSIENEESDIIRNNICPKSVDYKFSSEGISFDQNKKAELISVKNINNNYLVNTNINENELPISIFQTRKVNKINKEKNLTNLKNKDNKKCRKNLVLFLKLLE